MISDLTDVPALTLLNPWAHLIAHHGKDIENRGWVPGPVTRLLIHAGKGWDYAAQRQYQTLLGEERSYTSAIVAVAIIDGVCSVTVNAPPEVRCPCGQWAAHGQYHWRLRHVVALREPVPAKGRLGLWRPAPDEAAAVERQLAVAR